MWGSGGEAFMGFLQWWAGQSWVVRILVSLALMGAGAWWWWSRLHLPPGTVTIRSDRGIMFGIILIAIGLLLLIAGMFEDDDWI